MRFPLGVTPVGWAGLYYRSEDGQVLSVPEVCHRLGVDLDRAPREFVEYIPPPFSLLPLDGPVTTVDIHERRYRLRSGGGRLAE